MWYTRYRNMVALAAMFFTSLSLYAESVDLDAGVADAGIDFEDDSSEIPPQENIIIDETAEVEREAEVRESGALCQSTTIDTYLLMAGSIGLIVLLRLQKRKIGN